MALTDLIDLSAQPPAEAPLAEFLDRLCDRLGFDFAAYAGTNPVAGAVHAYVNYPEAWKAHYIEHGLHRVDPTLLVARRSIGPVDWRRLTGDAGYDPVFRDAHDFGIGERGLTIPVRGPFGDIGMLSVTRRASDAEWDGLVERSLGDLQAVAVHIHDVVMGSDVLSRALRHPNLSAREREALQWAAAGKSQADIADILSISQRTVEVHLGSARTKLHALTTAQAVGRGIALGIIHPL
jgi:DNA-binding CsgD family transcriptional regulator